MSFRIDLDRMRLLFTFGDRDLALAFADLEGFNIIGQRHLTATEPSQDTPGIWSYRLAKRRSAAPHAPRKIIRGRVQSEVNSCPSALPSSSA